MTPTPENPTLGTRAPTLPTGTVTLLFTDAEEIGAVIKAAVAQSGAAGPADMGKVIALVKPQVAGRADMGEVSKLVKAALA